MENKIKNMELAFVCSADLNSMKEQGNGRFCNQCNRVIKDFRNATRDDLEQEIVQNQGKVCGRFKKSQMSSAFLKYAAATALIATLNGCIPENITPGAESEQSIEIIESDFEISLVGIVIELPPDDESFHAEEIYQPPVIDVDEDPSDQ